LAVLTATIATSHFLLRIRDSLAIHEAAFRERSDRLGIPGATVRTLRRLIRQHVEHVAIRDQVRGRLMEAALVEWAGMCLTCADPAAALRDECVRLQGEYLTLFNHAAEGTERSMARSPRKPTRLQTRLPKAYRS
jgi:hypothetical protein